MSIATTLNLTPTAAAPTATPAPATGAQCVVFANDGGSPTVNASATDPVMVGDTGTGGLAGNVPAPPAGSAAAGKFLKADGTFAVPAGSSLTITEVDIPSTTAGEFTIAHGLGSTPVAVVIEMTALGMIAFYGARYDGTDLYLNASGAGLTAKAQCFTT